MAASTCASAQDRMAEAEDREEDVDPMPEELM